MNDKAKKWRKLDHAKRRQRRSLHGNLECQGPVCDYCDERTFGSLYYHKQREKDKQRAKNKQQMQRISERDKINELLSDIARHDDFASSIDENLLALVHRYASSADPDGSVDMNRLRDAIDCLSAYRDARHVSSVNTMKSIFGSIYMDSDDEFDRINVQFSGLPNLMDRFSRRMAAAAKIPYTKDKEVHMNTDIYKNNDVVRARSIVDRLLSGNGGVDHDDLIHIDDVLVDIYRLRDAIDDADGTCPDVPQQPKWLNRWKSEHYRYKAAYGGRASGKTYSVSDAVVDATYRGVKKVICSLPWQVSLRESVKSAVVDAIGRADLTDFYCVEHDRIVGKNGSEIIFALTGVNEDVGQMRCWDDVDIVWVEEAQRMSRDALHVLYPSVRKPGSELWFTLNPDRACDPVYYDLVLGHRDNVYACHVNWHDNPCMPLALEYERLYLKRTDPVMYKHIWCGGLNPDKCSATAGGVGVIYCRVDGACRAPMRTAGDADGWSGGRVYLTGKGGHGCSKIQGGGK